MIADGLAPSTTPHPDFASIALPHLDAAYNLARWLLRDPIVAEDVVQDAMLRAMTYFGTFRGGNARAWLLQIVRTTAYTRLASKRDGKEIPLNIETHDPVDPADDPERAFARGEGSSFLERALNALPHDLRGCVVLRELEEMSYRDISRITGVPLGTVMSRLWRARQALLRFGQENPA